MRNTGSAHSPVLRIVSSTQHARYQGTSFTISFGCLILSLFGEYDTLLCSPLFVSDVLLVRLALPQLGCEVNQQSARLEIIDDALWDTAKRLPAMPDELQTMIKLLAASRHNFGFGVLTLAHSIQARCNVLAQLL